MKTSDEMNPMGGVGGDPSMVVVDYKMPTSVHVELVKDPVKTSDELNPSAVNMNPNSWGRPGPRRYSIRVVVE